MQPDYCGQPQLYQTCVQYIHVIARPSTLPAARSSVSSGTSTVRIISSPSTQSATSGFMEPSPQSMVPPAIVSAIISRKGRPDESKWRGTYLIPNNGRPNFAAGRDPRNADAETVFYDRACHQTACHVCGVTERDGRPARGRRANRAAFENQSAAHSSHLVSNTGTSPAWEACGPDRSKFRPASMLSGKIRAFTIMQITP